MDTVAQTAGKAQGAYRSGWDLYEAYTENLDGSYPAVDICGLKYVPSYALRMTDPIAFRIGFSDFADCLLSDGETSEEIIDDAANYLPQ